MNQMEILVWKNTMTEMKTTLDGFNIRLDRTQKKICKLEARPEKNRDEGETQRWRKKTRGPQPSLNFHHSAPGALIPAADRWRSFPRSCLTGEFTR